MAIKSATRYQVATSALILLVGSAVGVLAIRIWTGMIVDQAIEGRCTVVRSLAASAAEALRHRTPDSGSTVSRDFVSSTMRDEKLGVREIRILTPEGEPIEGAERAPDLSPEARRALEAPGMTHWMQAEEGEERLVVASPLTDSGRRDATLLVTFDMGRVNGRKTEVVLHVLGLVGTLGLVNFLTVGWIVRRWLHPVGELSRRMSEVQQGDYDVVVDENRKDELGDLARTFNAMIQGVSSARKHSMELARKQANIEKFAALGRLSAGVAHEINNPVGGILTCLETMKEMHPGSDRYKDYLSLVRSGLERIGKIVKQLLSFSRQPAGDAERTAVALNALLKEVMVLSLFHNREDHVEVRLRFGDLPPIVGAPDLLNQLFLNLVLNALQAMPEGGTLTLTTWADGADVFASIEDTGPGIPEDKLEAIFDPFFTTKEVGVGTGLGLSVALGIVEAHDGSIRAENPAHGGARFVVRIPVEVPAERKLQIGLEEPA